ncbi:isochorismatase family protein [Eoetvoesiella caeni]
MNNPVFFEQRGFGRRIGFGKKSAIIAIDLAKGFTDPEQPLGADLSSQIEAVNSLTSAGRAVGVPVFFTTVRYDDPELRDAGIWRLKQGGIDSLSINGEGWQLDPRLFVAPDDQMVIKKYASCFFGTDLLSRLTCSGVDTVFIVGTSTSGCVRATAVDACQYGFRPIVVSEAVGDRSSAAHRQSLFDLHTRYADVIELAEALEFFSTIVETQQGHRNTLALEPTITNEQI